jgi:hypothetical protein
MSSLASLPDLSFVRTTPTPQITALVFSTSNSNAKPLVTSILGKQLTLRQGIFSKLTRTSSSFAPYISDRGLPSGRHRIYKQNQARASFPNWNHQDQEHTKKQSRVLRPVSLIYPLFFF